VGTFQVLLGRQQLAIQESLGMVVDRALDDVLAISFTLDFVAKVEVCGVDVMLIMDSSITPDVTKVNVIVDKINFVIMVNVTVPIATIATVDNVTRLVVTLGDIINGVGVIGNEVD
jgi:hypothetical protein